MLLSGVCDAGFHALARGRLFFFNDTATTEIYTLSLHDALPISSSARRCCSGSRSPMRSARSGSSSCRSEEHTSELQSRPHLVCRLLLEKKKHTAYKTTTTAATSSTARDHSTLFASLCDIRDVFA